MEITLKLKWPPSVNHYKRVGAIVRTKNGKMYQKRVNSRETKMYFYHVHLEANKVMAIGWPEMALRDDISWGCNITLHPPDKRRRDIDNVLKVLLDSLVSANVIQDDSQITRLFVQKLNTIGDGEVLVHLYPLEEQS